MVTEKAYKRYEERKKKSTIDKDEDKVHFILDEIAKMKGYKEILVGKRKIHPIVQYVDFLIGQKFGFKIIKRGEEYYDRQKEEKKIAEKNISLIDQYTDLLGYQNIEFIKSIRNYNELVAKNEGYASFKEKEKLKAAELGLTSVDEYHQLQAEERGFDSYEDYQKYISDVYAIKETYANLVPKEDFDAVLKLIKDKWVKDHQKFILFSTELWKDVLEPYFNKTNGEEAVILMQDIRTELDKFHASNPGSLNVYNIDDISIGLSYSLEEKNVDAILSKDKKSVKFRLRKT